MPIDGSRIVRPQSNKHTHTQGAMGDTLYVHRRIHDDWFRRKKKKTENYLTLVMFFFRRWAFLHFSGFFSFVYHHRDFSRCNQNTLARRVLRLTCDGGQFQLLLSFASLMVHSKAVKQTSFASFIFGWPALCSLCHAKPVFFGDVVFWKVHFCVDTDTNDADILTHTRARARRARSRDRTCIGCARGRELIGLPSNKTPTDSLKTKIKVNAPQRTKQKANRSISLPIPLSADGLK